MPSVFTKIINGEIKGTIIHQDEHCAAIQDVQPQAPKHILIVPKRELTNLAAATKSDQQLLGHLMLTAAQVAKDQGIDASGYRVVLNINNDGGQTVPHLHIHVLGGRPMTWPPG
jgi:histidine triad (HIT) family protein